MLCFADPVKYDYAVRRVRVSNKPKEARAYLLNMYRYDGVYKYACQMCHDSCANIESTQVFNNPEVELDPMHLCLCPNCASLYKKIRNDEYEMNNFKNRILRLSEAEISNGEYVVMDVENQELWFTQTHIAEIKALLQLAEDVKNADAVNPTQSGDEEDKAGLSVYDSYVGKLIKRKDGFSGQVTKVDGEYVTVEVITPSTKGGPQKGDETRIQLSFIISKTGVYEII